jgi:predicted MFS family arabinose efflux permease
VGYSRLCSCESEKKKGEPMAEVESSKTSIGSKRELLALSLSRFVTQPLSIISGLLLIDIASSFNTPVGLIGQIRTSAAITEMVFALMISALAIRFSQKSLLLAGLLFIMVSSAGSGLSQNLPTLMAFYAISGVGLAMVSPITLTMVGDHFPSEKRAQVVGLMVAILAASYTIGAPMVNLLSGIGGWRYPLLAYAFPMSTLAFLTTFFIISKEPTKTSPSFESRSYFRGYRALISSKSAVACLFGATAYMAAQVVPLTFGASYLRQVMALPTSSAAIVTVFNSLSYITGSLTASKFIRKLGGRRTAWISALLLTLLYTSAFMLGNLYLVVACLTLGYFSGGVCYAASNNLALAQIPSHRATMMSVFISVIALGNTFGNSIGGFALVSIGYMSLSVVLGVFGLISVIIYAFFTSEPK